MAKSIIKKVSESEPKEDKNGKIYKNCIFSRLGQEYQDVPGMGRVAVHQRTREIKVNLYLESYLDQKEQFGFSIPVGGYIFGDIVTRNVEPYEVPMKDRLTGEVTGSQIVSTFTTVVFGDTTSASFEADTRNAFRSRGHKLAAPEEVVAEPAQSMALPA